jgi:hypothetical protein
MARVRGLLVLFAALLFGLAPAAVRAHDGVPHSENASGAASSFLEQSWSPACPPGSGHVCGCGNLSLCEGGAKPIVVSRCTVFFLPPCLSGVAPVHDAPARASTQFSPSLPRAPPEVS